MFSPNTITIDMFGNAFFRQFKYKLVTHARVFSLKPNFKISKRQGIFIAGVLRHLPLFFGYGNMCSWEKIKERFIYLPKTPSGEIDFLFMEQFIREVEISQTSKLENSRNIRLNAYLHATGYSNYTLTQNEEKAIQQFDKILWKKFNLKKLYGESSRGRRLKGSDRLQGNLPFVTAGEVNTGISAFIGNNVTVFSPNTTTIDMFGSAKYRNYEYGADDHVAVVHTEKLPNHAAIFVTAACHKAAHTGKFNYGHNFYASDADELNIMLPAKKGAPDIKTMETLISAVQKLVIKDVVDAADQHIAATKKIVEAL